MNLQILHSGVFVWAATFACKVNIAPQSFTMVLVMAKWCTAKPRLANYSFYKQTGLWTKFWSQNCPSWSTNTYSVGVQLADFWSKFGWNTAQIFNFKVSAWGTSGHLCLSSELCYFHTKRQRLLHCNGCQASHLPSWQSSLLSTPTTKIHNHKTRGKKNDRHIMYM